MTVYELHSLLVLSVYPNPFGNEFQIELSKLEDDVPIEIHAIDDRLISVHTLHSTSSTIDASNWERDAYYLSVYDKEHRQIIQLVKQ